MVQNKNDKIFIFLAFLTGFWEIHKFYQKKIGLGILYLFTAGIFLVGWIYDMYIIALR